MDVSENYFVKEQQDYTNSPRTRPGWKRRYDFVVQHVQPTDTVLDCACGLGQGTVLISQKCRTAVGADIDPYFIEYCKKTSPDLTFHRVDVSRGLPFPDNHFDVVASIEMLEHLPTTAAVHRALKHFRRVLKPGGIFIASGPNRRSETRLSARQHAKLALLTLFGSHFKQQTRWHEHYRAWTPRSFEAILTKYFEAVSVYGERAEGITQDVVNAPYLMARARK